MGVTDQIGEFVWGARIDSLPTALLELGKRAFVDTIGVALAGRADEIGKRALAVLGALGGAGRASIWGEPGRTDPATASLVNATLSHALDYDDFSWTMGGHASAVMVPAVLAVGQECRSSGADVLLAYLLGVEVACKIAKGINLREHSRRGWHATSTVGVLGAAVAAGKLLGLTAAQLKMAIGIAASQASGLSLNFGTMTKALHAGNAARAGVMAALLARAGFTAHRDILEGETGYARIFSAGGDHDVRHAGRDLGTPYELTRSVLYFKKYPCCGLAHGFMDGVRGLRPELAGRFGEIEGIEVAAAPGRLSTLRYSRPTTGLEGRFSLEYCIAISLLDERMGLRAFTDEAVRQPAAQALLKKVVAAEDPGRRFEDNLDGEVRITLAGGISYGCPAKAPEHVHEPLSWEEIARKYMDTAGQALGEAAAASSLALLGSLENVAAIEVVLDALEGVPVR